MNPPQVYMCSPSWTLLPPPSPYPPSGSSQCTSPKHPASCIFYLDPGFHFYSPDVDECANPRSCPDHSTCHNSLGNYSCVCNPGFQSRSGRKSFQGPGEMCQGMCRGLLGNQVQCVWKDRSGGEKLRWVLAEFKALLCKAEANSNWFIHTFLQQTLLEHLLYAKNYSRDGGYCDNTEKSIYSTGTSYHGERIRQQTKHHHVFGLSLLMMAWHSSMQWQLCWLNCGLEDPLWKGLPHKVKVVLAVGWQLCQSWKLEVYVLLHESCFFHG